LIRADSHWAWRLPNIKDKKGAGAPAAENKESGFPEPRRKKQKGPKKENGEWWKRNHPTRENEQR
jgi:hypothetical protein